jgi:hypothetical protein
MSELSTSRLRWAAAIAVMLAALLAPAISNGFPLVFADTGGYLARAFERTLDIGRSALYGMGLAAGLPLAFWPVIIVQAALCVWIIVLTLRAHGLPRPGTAVLIVVALSVLTALPWYTAQLMPDIFFPLAVLAVHLLAFRRAALRGWEVAALIALVALAIASHMGVLALLLVLLVAFAALWLLAPRLRLPRPQLSFPAIALGAGLLFAPLSNLAIAGQFTFTPGGTNFLFGRLVQDGIVARYLADRCPDATLRLCAYRDQMPANADGWLWGYDSPLHKLGWWQGFEPEARRIIGETLIRYPAAHVSTAAWAMLTQLVTLRSGDGMGAGDNWHAEGIFQRYAPELLPRFKASRQQNDDLFPRWLNWLHLPIAFLTMAGLPVLVALGVRGRVSPPGAALALTVLLALLANAAISGVFSNPGDRYQSRVAWLAPLAFAVAALGGAGLVRKHSVDADIASQQS